MPDPQKKRSYPYVRMRVNDAIATNVDSLKAAVKERDSAQEHSNRMHDTVEDATEATKDEQAKKAKLDRLRKALKGK